MITKVQCKAFKGFPDVEQLLGRINLIVGPNGSGKSARTDALQLLLNGNIMGVGKRNQDIFAACASPGEKKIFVGCTIEVDGKPVKFLKRYAQDDAGAVSLVHHVRDTKATAANYAAALGSCGNPKIVDPTIFMGLSPAKQIEEIFSLFPPEGDLAKLTAQIEAARERLNAKQKAKVAQENVAAALLQSVSRLELGTGTLADVEREETATAAALEAARAELAAEKSRIAEAEYKERADADHVEQMKKLNEQAAEAAAKAKAEADAQYQELLRKSKEAQDKANREAELQKARAVQEAENRLLQNANKIGATLPEEYQQPAPMQQHIDKMDEIKQSGAAISAIEKILSAMQRAGCDACAAGLIAKRELRMLRGGL